MEISTLSTQTQREDEGQLVHVRDAHGELQYAGTGLDKRPVTILVAGSYSKTYRRAADAQRDRLMKQRRHALTGEQVELQQLELTARCVLSWEGITANGLPFPLTVDNAITVFTAAPWVREQVEEAMHDHAGFSKPASAI